MSVAFSYDIRRLASSSYDIVQIWDAKTGAMQQEHKGHTSIVMSVAFSYDGRRLASSSADCTVWIWDARTGALPQELEISMALGELSFSPDECSFITNFGSIDLGQSFSLSIRTTKWSGYCVDIINKSWITWNGNNVLWLPREYRPFCSTVKDQTIVLGLASGQVLFIKYKPDVSLITGETLC
jgi:WD40 repeat protein